MEMKLRILILEAATAQAGRIEASLGSAGEALLSDSREAFMEALETFRPDIVLCGNVPGFGGLSALKMLRRERPDIPVLMVCPPLSGVEAVELIHEGAADYVPDDRLEILPQAIVRALSREQGIRARKAAEREQRDSNRILDRMFNSTHFRIAYLDSRFDFIRVNRAYADAFGRQVDFFPGKNHFRLNPDKECESLFRKAFESGETITLSGKPYFPDRRETSSWDWTLQPVKDDEGKIDALLFVLLDASLRKRTEDALRASHKLLESIIENAPIRVFWKDGDLRYLGCNIAFAKDAGMENPGDLIGRDDFQMTWKEQAEIYREDDRRVMDSGNPKLGYEEPQTTPDGKTIWLRTSKVPLRDAEGKVFGLLGIYDDITERKQEQETLVKSIADLAEAQHLAHIGSWSWDIATDAIAWSAEYYRIYGIDPDLPTPNYAEHLKAYAAESAMRLDAAVRRAVESGEPYALELELADHPGKWVLARGTARFDAKGKVAGLSGTAQDITERKAAELGQKKLTRALTLLSRCNSALVHTDNELDLLSRICRLAVESGGYLMAWVGFPEQDEKKTVRPVAESGYEEGYLDHADITWADDERGRGPTGTAMRTGLIQINQDCLTNPRMAPWREAALTRGYQSSIALPLLHAGKTLGVLTIYSREPDAFGAEETDLLAELADDLAFGIANLRTRGERDHALLERQQYADKLRASLEDALQAISATVEMRDPYTAGHQNRAAELASAIAREMALPEEQIHGIRLAASVHDLGKIRVPAEILSKPSRLSDLEYRLIQNHSQAGYDILKEIEFPWPIAQAVLQHHERLDGSGYPNGLKGEEIILEARILAVADVVEAMSSHRPYRPGLGLDLALQEIGNGSGVRYDPSAVEACLRLFREKRFRLG